jgi:hypothetical protein
MKFKTFRAIAVSGLVAFGGGAVVLAYMACDRGGEGENAKPEPRLTAGATRAPSKGGDAPAAPAAPAAPGDPLAFRPMDAKILDRVAAGIQGDKVKDAFPGETYKVNLYKDPDGKRRAKVDLDRDEKWDEKWDFEAESGQEVVKRHVATGDDERYDVELRLRGGAWVKK